MQDLKLTIDLLPRGAWGNDLSKTLSKKDWDTLREHAYAKAGNRCAICGNDKNLQAHEVWAFDLAQKTQTLKDVIALCPACHGVKHMRNSQRIGYEAQTKAHFIKVNGCDEMTFAVRYAQAQFEFHQRNTVLRWTVKADLKPFGGEGIEIPERQIPFIEDPYAGVDWSTVRHRKEAVAVEDKPNILYERVCLYDPGEEGEAALERQYHILRRADGLPPKICSVETDNYSGTVTVVSDRVNKIQWVTDDCVVKTKFAFGARFRTSFCVEDLTANNLRFLLFNENGLTASSEFGLTSGCCPN